VAALRAQTGEITGIVSDPASAAIPGVRVSIRETSAGTGRIVETNTEGVYGAPSLRPGEYSVQIQRAGFKQVARMGVQLQVGQQLLLDFRVELGAVNERLVVEGQASVLDTETAVAGQVVQSSQILELPLLGRKPYALGGLVPGVRVSRGVNDLPGRPDQHSIRFDQRRPRKSERVLEQRESGVGRPDPYAWFNTQVFSTPPAYHFGTTPRTFSAARSDYTRGADVALHKNTKLKERLSLQFRAEAFNLSNTPVFGPPNTSFGSPAFGAVSAQANQPRILQLALKLSY